MANIEPIAIMRPVSVFANKITIESDARAIAEQILESESALDTYCKLKNAVIALESMLERVKANAIDEALRYTNGATGKFAYKGLEIQIKNSAVKYEYPADVMEYDAKIKIMQETLKAMKKKAEAECAIAGGLNLPDTAARRLESGITLSITFTGGENGK